MSYAVVFRTEALQDITGAMDWYDEQQAGLAERFYAQLESKLEQVAEHPFLYSIRYAEVRCVVVDDFPYLMHYYVEEERRRVTVLGIIHTSRDPRTGQERL